MDFSQILSGSSPVRSCSISAVITRADGYREDLGRIAYWDKNLFKQLKWKLGRTGWRKTSSGLHMMVPLLMVAEPGIKHGDLKGLISVIPLLPLAILQVNAGRAIVTNRLNSAGTIPQYQGWGTQTGTTGQTDTTLFFETYCTTNDGSHNQRPTGSVTRPTTSTTNDTFQSVATLTSAAIGNSGSHGALSGPITNAGLFDTNGQAADLVTATAGGNLYMKGDFADVNLTALLDSIQFTSSVQYS